MRFERGRVYTNLTLPYTNLRKINSENSDKLINHATLYTSMHTTYSSH